MKYWENELPSQQCYLPNGKKITCDFVYDDRSWMASSIGFVNLQIENAIQRHIGGWCESSQDRYETALKKKASNSTGTKKQQWFRPDQRSLNQPRHNLGAVAGSVATKRGIEVPVQPRPDPIRVPTPEQMRPRKGPIPKESII